jgi:hypothetical protein
MDALPIRKNILDIEERNFRHYFTTCLIIAFTTLSIIISLFAFSEISKKYFLFLFSVGGVAILLQTYLSIFYRDLANDRLNKIKKLQSSIRKPRL